MGRNFPFILRIDLLKLYDIALDYGGKHTVEITELPEVEFAFGELSKMRPKTFAVFIYNKQTSENKIVIDILQMRIPKVFKKEKNLEAIRKKIRRHLTRWLAHESAHWYMYHTDRKAFLKSGKTIKKVSRVLLSIAIGALIVFGGIVIFDSYSYVQYATWIANIFRGVFILFLGFGFYAGLWMAQEIAKGIAYIFSKSEQFAMKFERLAKKDPRWNEIVFVDWEE